MKTQGTKMVLFKHKRTKLKPKINVRNQTCIYAFYYFFQYQHCSYFNYLICFYIFNNSFSAKKIKMEQQQHHARRLQPTNQQPTRITSQDVLPIYVRNESNINQIYEALIGTRVETNQTQFYHEFERIRIEEVMTQ
jgi:hypothetical protein